MKKTAAALLFAVMTTTSVLAADVEAVLDRYMNAWNSHDKISISHFYTSDVVWYDLGADTSIQGKEKVSKAITDYFMGYVPDMYWYKSGDVFVSDNTIVYEWIYGGTFNGQWGNQTITDKKFMIKGLSTTTVNDQGKIIRTKDYYNVDSFKRALGVAQ